MTVLKNTMHIEYKASILNKNIFKNILKLIDNII